MRDKSLNLKMKIDFEIVYLRKKRHVAEFFFPEIPDIASVHEDDINPMLPAPIECGSASRQRSSV